MGGVMLLARTEALRLWRNKRYLIFTLALPVVLYLAVGRQHGTGSGVGIAAYYMVAMGMLGAFSGTLTGNAQRISQERKDGWIRQLRLTALPANGYVIAKVIVSLVTTVPSVLILLLLGRFYGGVQLGLGQWLAIGVTIWFASTIFAALAVAIGYRFVPDQVQAVSMICYFLFAILGGLWFPISGVLKDIGQLVPTYAAVKISTDVISGASVSAALIAGLVVWLGIFLALATAAVRATAEKI